MDKIAPVKVSYREALLDIEKRGVGATETRSQITDIAHSGALPDVLAYLQKETELTRATILKMLIDSGRIEEFIVNPQKFMDVVAGIIKRELHKLIIYANQEIC